MFCMEQGTFEEPVEKFLAVLFSPKVHYSFHNSWLLCLVMNPISSIHSPNGLFEAEF